LRTEIPPIARSAASAKSVKSYVRDRIFPADEGARIELKTVMHDYRAWCTKKGLAPIALAEFLDEIEKVFGRLGVEIKVRGDQRVYRLRVKLGANQRLVAAVH
jgi:hypothetical protein